ncbi:RING finger and CHY zinc finger domain-containing protein 1-like [Pocillopora verrucosa]|uniref:RING finger and CHY zinc finger domain-containing protein 1-like n=1 Tax=Pocillopora verrucosa TaxID=203993 RepID=UPI003341E8BF
MERELKERRKRETKVREDRTAEESLPLQETPPWQCEHYQRRCTVKFPCCGVFYPCERCHNLSETCPANDKKARHATHVKCRSCGREEEINEESQTCKRCGVKLSEYFCPKCKHFMGIDKNPFHCEKCKICRFYKDRSFHCDVCNVCMEKRMEGKHECRPNSGHDDCCICLEVIIDHI